MTWIYNKSLLLVVVALLAFTGCSISYRFNGGTIDYTQIKSIAISDVTNRAAIVYPRFAASFTEALFRINSIGVLYLHRHGKLSTVSKVILPDRSR